jgi:acetolactate synthase-1/2/3 large subunit
MTGAKACIEALKREKVKVAFGLPGGAVLPLYEELQDSGIRHVLVRHEQCAAHMADGYARVSGKVGLCIATSGPGATNLVTGIATALMDSSPIVAITGQVPRNDVGHDAFQEADITGVTTPITKHNIQVTCASEIPQTIRAAFHIAFTGRPGPVLVDIPRDVQSEKGEMNFSQTFSLPGYQPLHEPHPGQVEKTASLLEKAERPVILAGGGVRIADASAELLALAERLRCPVVTTFMGKGVFPENHPLSLGKIGVYGGTCSNQAICEADLILAVGMRFADRATGSIRKFAQNAKIVHIDIDPSEIGKIVKVDVPIVGDAKATLRAIFSSLKSKQKRQPSTWLKQLEQIKEKQEHEEADIGTIMKPMGILKQLRELLPKDTVVTVDVGQHQMWAAIYFDIYHPKSFISSGGLGTMGFGFPAALGAKMAKPKGTIVNITGDGSFLMTQQELATSIEEKIPVIVVIFDNRSLGMVAQLQRVQEKRPFAVDMGKSPDFVKLAEAYGAQGIRVESYGELGKAVKTALKSDVTTVLDVKISPEENVVPMVMPGDGLDSLVWG